MKKIFELPKVTAAEAPDPLSVFPKNVNLYKESYTIAEFASELIEQGGIVFNEDVKAKNPLHNFQKRVGYYVKQAGGIDLGRTKKTRDSREVMQKALNNKHFVKFLQTKALISYKETEKQCALKVAQMNESDRKRDLEYQLEEANMPPDGDEYDSYKTAALKALETLEALDAPEALKALKVLKARKALNALNALEARETREAREALEALGDREALEALEALRGALEYLKKLREDGYEEAENNELEMNAIEPLLEYKLKIVFDVLVTHLIKFDSAKLEKHIKLKLSAEKKRFNKTADEQLAISELKCPSSYYKLKPELSSLMETLPEIQTEVKKVVAVNAKKVIAVNANSIVRAEAKKAVAAELKRQTK